MALPDPKDRRLADVLPVLVRRASLGMTFGLDRMYRALAALGDPQRASRAVHVAGTNGKGSTSAMVESVARRAGLRTGLYTSPHLCRVAERIRIDGEPLDDGALAEALGTVIEGAGVELSFFETLTAAAFVAFRRARVDLAVVEVGLGGRLDATNVIEAPLATAVTSIALEHTALLGGTLDAIAREKAGIFKKASPVVLGPMAPRALAAMREAAAAVRAGPTWRVERTQRIERVARIGRRSRPADAETILLAPAAPGEGFVILPPAGSGRRPVHMGTPGLSGAHQLENAAVACGVAFRLAETFPGIEDAIAGGLAEARWPGRIERIEHQGATILLDCAHNPHGADALARALAAERQDPSRTLLVFGALADKAFRPMLERLAPFASRRFYVAPGGRAPAPFDELAAVAPGERASEPVEALGRAIESAAPGDTIVVAGSIYLVGSLRGFLLGIPCDPIVAL